MGMLEPLTAQALGRSPYDEVVEWDNGDAEDNPDHYRQEYDHRGRPINPETKRLNRDIIRSHNEVMLVIGVAEPDNPQQSPEVASARRHELYEDGIGVKIATTAHRCIEAAGVFGIHALRQRILIYRRYSEIPFWDLYQAAKKEFSLSKDIIAGAPSSFAANYLDRHVAQLWIGRTDRLFARQSVHEIWSYVRVHLELYAATQRLGLTSSTTLLPPLSYFIPFTAASPMPAPPLPEDFSLGSLVKFVGDLAISVTPFLVWVMAQRTIRDWRPQIWAQIFRRLPNTGLNTTIGKKATAPLPPPPPPPAPWQENDEPAAGLTQAQQDRTVVEDSVTPRGDHGQAPDESAPVGAVRRQSTFSARGDEYGSDYEDNEGVSATLISFDVEASESAVDAPPGLWSAELRPSVAMESRSGANALPVYRDTMLTQLPPLLASQIFADAITRLVMAPYEATALRLAARTIRTRLGLSCSDLLHVNLLSGLNWTGAMNFLGAELLHLVLLGEVWAVFTTISQYFHMDEEEWKEVDTGEPQPWMDNLTG